MINKERKAIAEYLLEKMACDNQMLMSLAMDMPLDSEVENKVANKVANKNDELDKKINGIIPTCDKKECRFNDKGFCNSQVAIKGKCEENGKYFEPKSE